MSCTLSLLIRLELKKNFSQFKHALLMLWIQGPLFGLFHEYPVSFINLDALQREARAITEGLKLKNSSFIIAIFEYWSDTISRLSSASFRDDWTHCSNGDGAEYFSEIDLKAVWGYIMLSRSDCLNIIGKKAIRGSNVYIPIDCFHYFTFTLFNDVWSECVMSNFCS